MKSTFTEGICPEPGTSGNHTGLSGGFPIADGHGDKGLINSPYDNGICPTPGGKETSGELGTTPSLVDVKDAPSGTPSGMSGIGLLNEHQSDQTFRGKS